MICHRTIIGEDAKADAYVQYQPFKKWFDLMVAGGAANGRDFKCAANYKSWMIEAGFVDVVEKVVLVPVNAWPVDVKDNWMGKWMTLDALKFVDGSKKFLQAAGMPEDHIPGFLEDVRRSCLDPNLRGYLPRKSTPKSLLARVVE